MCHGEKKGREKEEIEYNEDGTYFGTYSNILTDGEERSKQVMDCKAGEPLCLQRATQTRGGGVQR